jgi:hypothetical protein
MAAVMVIEGATHEVSPRKENGGWWKWLTGYGFLGLKVFGRGLEAGVLVRGVIMDWADELAAEYLRYLRRCRDDVERAGYLASAMRLLEVGGRARGAAEGAGISPGNVGIGALPTGQYNDSKAGRRQE